MKKNIFSLVSLLSISLFFFTSMTTITNNSLNGVFSGRSSFNPNMTTTLNITTNANIVSITKTTNPSVISDKSTLFFSNGISFNNDIINIPNDGQKWWIVPFDNIPPMKVSEGGNGGTASGELWEFKCYCGAVKQTTGCSIVTTSKSKSCSWSEQCQSDCCQGVMEKTGSGNISYKGSFAIIPAEQISVDGIIYQ